MRRKNWQEKIIEAMSDPSGQKKWCSNHFLRRRIAENENIDLDEVPMALTNYLTVLIKNGYVERADKPYKLREKVNYARKEFIYRLTSKKFVYVPRGHRLALKNKFVTAEQIDLGFDLWVFYKKYPKWFRDLMK